MATVRETCRHSPHWPTSESCHVLTMWVCVCAGDKIEIIYFMSSSEKSIATAWEFCNMLGLQCDCVSYNIIGGRPSHVSRCASRYYRNTSHNQNLVTDCITQTHPFPYVYLSQRPIREHLVCERASVRSVTLGTLLIQTSASIDAQHTYCK